MFIVFIAANSSGATQWCDQGLHLVMKKETDKHKKDFYDKNITYEMDCANNGSPVIHTSSDNPHKKALPQNYQALMICKGYESLQAQSHTHDFRSQLINTGYLFLTNREETLERYLSHILSKPNQNDRTNIFKCIQSLSLNPFTASYLEILNAKHKPGPKPTDTGKMTRNYSVNEVAVISQIFGSSVSKSNVDNNVQSSNEQSTNASSNSN